MRDCRTHSDKEVSMGHSIARKRARQIALLRTQFAQADGLAFADVLPAARIETALRAAADDWRWHGRRVKLVDGTTVTMPDTQENQKEYPQQAAQQPGLGFPIARLVVVFCLSCGAVLDAAMGRYQGKKTGENTLLRA